jgi:cytochrome P450
MTAQQATLSYPFPVPPSIYHPSPELAALLDTQPVAPVAMPDGKTAWVATRNADVRQVLVDPRFSRTAAAAPEAAKTELTKAIVDDNIANLDPPEHTRLRSLVAKAFTARRVEQLRPRVVTFVEDLLDKLEAAPRPADLVENFSLPLPVQVICEMLGVPPADRDQFHAWSDVLMGTLEWTAQEREAAQRAMGGYFAGLIAAKRDQPADDLLSALIAARDADGDRLSEAELVALGITVLVGGHETTANQIDMCLLTLLHHPEQMRWFVANLDSVGPAVEELMRFSGTCGCRRVPRCCRCSAWPTGTRRCTGTPTSSTCPVDRPSTSPSVPASTTASARSWLGSSCRKPCVGCSAGCPASGSPSPTTSCGSSRA